MNHYENHVSATAAEHITQWLTQPKYADYRDELEQMIANERWDELEDAFFQIIPFGTGGRRGPTGIGSNRINKVTIGESAQALVSYASKIDAKAPEKGVVIACDTRLSSPELSNYAAAVCAANGFKTYLFESFRATPELSFAVRELGAAAGIVISASHNPPADNGFKAYWSDGGQLVSPHDKGVLAEAAEVTTIHTSDFNEAVKSGRITIIGSAIDKKYIAAVTSQAEGTARDLSIVYSPLHGAGQTNTLPVLQEVGFHVSPVAEQMTPDGNFPTVEGGKPNPEEKSANDMAVAQMLAQNADIAITNDPDADRVGVTVRHHGTAVYLNGNQSAVLAADYVLRKAAARGELTPKHYMAKTIVTTDLLAALAQDYGITMYSDMLIGFKYIGKLLHEKDDSDETFVIGGEESYGLLKGTYARDKDGAVGALPLAESAAELKQQEKTLVDRLYELYDQYGIYEERLDTVVFPGAKGFANMQSIMDRLRTSPPTSVDGEIVTAVRDYDVLQRTDIATGEKTPVPCSATGNVIVLECGDYRRRITIRPSGTEPKLKFYVQWFMKSDDSVRDVPQMKQRLEKISQSLEQIVLG